MFPWLFLGVCFDVWLARGAHGVRGVVGGVRWVGVQCGRRGIVRRIILLRLEHLLGCVVLLMRIELGRRRVRRRRT